MTTLRVMPDAEAVVRAYLVGVSDLDALFGNRFHASLPKTPVYPLAVVRQLGGVTIQREHLETVDLQVDVYDETKEGASLAARTLRAALLQMRDETILGAVVTQVDAPEPPQWLPDDVVPTPRPRYTFDIEVTLHPS